jgi:hypothetical protein
MTTPAGSSLLADALEFAVPLHIAEVRQLPFGERHRLALEAAAAIASQGDTLQYGSKTTRFGDGSREMRRHRDHGTARDETCDRCPEGKDSARCCLRRFRDRCGVCLRGQATYSPGEVFNFLARGLALLACQPGGVTWAGLHWCAWPHPRCPNPRATRRPPCCTCAGNCTGGLADGACLACQFCVNGCAAAAGKACCRQQPRAARIPVEGAAMTSTRP